MRSEVSEARPEVLHEQIAPAFVAMLDDASPLDDPAELEQLAATVLVALEQPEMPAEVAAAVFEAIEARRDADAAGVLAALAALAAEPLAGQAACGAERLAADGIVSAAAGVFGGIAGGRAAAAAGGPARLAALPAEPLAGQAACGAERLAADGIVSAAAGVGMLAVQEAVRVEGAGVELLVALLRRPGAREVQPAMLAIEHEHTGGALVQCALAPPARFKDARDLLDGVEGASAPEPVAPGELAARVVAAAHRAIDQEIALGHEAGAALPIVSRALTGDPVGLPRPAVLAPWEDDDRELIVDA